MPNDIPSLRDEHFSGVAADAPNDGRSVGAVGGKPYWAKHAAALAQRGWRCVPIMPGGKAPGHFRGGRYVNLPGWQAAGVPTAAEIVERTSWPVSPENRLHAGIGLVLGPQGDADASFVGAIDIDIQDAKLAEEVEQLAAGTLGDGPVRFGKRPKRLMIFRCSEPIGKMSSARFRLRSDAAGSAAHLVEVLAEGQQAVAHGRHPSGVDYEWRDGVGPGAGRLADLPLVTPDELRGFLAACGDAMRQAGGVEVGAAHEAPPPAGGTYQGDGNPMHRAGMLALLEEAGLVIRHKGTKVDIRCPFLADHSDRDETGTSLLSGGGINCCHASCLRRSQGAFLDQAKKLATDAGSDAEGIYQEAYHAAKQNKARDEFRDADKKTLGGVLETLEAGKVLTSQEAQSVLRVLGTAQVDEFLSSVEDTHGKDVAEGVRDALSRAKADAEAATTAVMIRPSGRGRSSITDALTGIGTQCRLDRHLRWDEATKTRLLVGILPGTQTWDQLGLKSVPHLYADPLGHSPVYPWTDEILTAVQVQLEAQDVFVTEEHAQKAVAAIAARNRFSAVGTYLRGGAWDGIPRLDDWLVRNAGADAGAFNKIVLRKWMIGAVARAVFPDERGGAAAQMDTVLTLAGKQQTRKSSFFRRLVPVAGWHTENALGDISSKDAVMRISSAWIIDLAEGASVRASEVEALKQFVTTTADMIRLPYARAVTRQVRRCAFGMTVNPDGVGFLKDSTGNRRFWVVEVEDINIAVLENERDQLWAEAVYYFDAGEKWWLDPQNPVDAKLINEAASVAEGHRAQTPTEELIKRYIVDFPTVDSRQRIAWAPRVKPLTVIAMVSDALNNLGRDGSSTPLYRDAQRALADAGWSRTKVKQHHGPVPRDKTIWIAPDGAKAVAQDKKGGSRTNNLARWLDAQQASGQIDQHIPSTGSGAADFAA